MPAELRGPKRDAPFPDWPMEPEDANYPSHSSVQGVGQPRSPGREKSIPKKGSTCNTGVRQTIDKQASVKREIHEHQEDTDA